MQKEYIDTHIIDNCTVAVYRDGIDNYCIKAFKNGASAQTDRNQNKANYYLSKNGFKFETLYYKCKVVIGHHETQLIGYNGETLLKKRNRRLIGQLDTCRVYSYH